MMATTIAPSPIAGGSFLIRDLAPEEVFTPEDFTDEQRQIAATASQFATQEVLPAAAQIEAKNFEVTRALLRKAGELGLLAIDIPEQYGGLAMDKTTSSIVVDQLAVLASFCVAFSAHVGIGTLPIVWFGTEEQKQKYLPRLATGELIGGYALSEASSGSDAMNIRARATLSADGSHYLLNGEKMWITNAGFADLFTVFAKVDGEKFSAFLVDRDAPGLSIGAEEHKLGIRGSSTCPLILSDCRIPAGNLLGEVGKGHHIAFNILNIGRLKLGVSSVGGARYSLDHGLRYARERKAFGKPIAEFGLIQQKIADCAVKVFVGESMAYRTVGTIDEALSSAHSLNAAATQSFREIQKIIEEYAVECSILKVWGSEMLDSVVDHVVQIYGGYGYVEEYPAERAYRDSRINRIFEGTNEINRLIITGWLMKRAGGGQLPLMPAIQRLMSEVTESLALRESSEREDAYGREIGLLANLKKIALFAAGCASAKYMAALADEQEVMADLADLLIGVYAFESGLLRARKLAGPRKLVGQGASSSVLTRTIVQLHGEQTMAEATFSAQRILAAVAEGDALRTQLAILRRLTRLAPVNAVALARTVAKQLIAVGRYSI